MRKHILKAVRAHAAAEYPRECCGLVVQIGRRQQYVRCRNLAEGAAGADRFELDPADYAAAEDLGAIVGVVHSHPDATSRASAADVALCNAGTVPWYILSWPEGDLNVLTPCEGVAPLEGRPFVHGTDYDCYGLIRGFYQLEYGITLPDFPRADGWWHNGENHYLERFEQAGFEVASGPLQRGDVVLMQVQAPAVNHGGVYLGDGQLLHHLYGRPSGRVAYGGYWLDRTALVVRYKGAA